MNSNEKLDAVLSYLKAAHDDRIIVRKGVNNDGTSWSAVNPMEFEKHWKDNIQIVSNALTDDIEMKEVEAIMDYLENENLVVSKVKDNSLYAYKKYMITFTGKLFMENGGFGAKHLKEVSQQTRIEQLETTQIRQSKNMTLLTGALVVVSLPAFGYNFFLLLQSDANIFTLQATTVMTISVLCVLGGLMVGLVLKEIKNK